MELQSRTVVTGRLQKTRHIKRCCIKFHFALTVSPFFTCILKGAAIYVTPYIASILTHGLSIDCPPNKAIRNAKHDECIAGKRGGGGLGVL